MQLSRLMSIVFCVLGFVCLDGMQLHVMCKRSSGRSHNRRYVPHHTYKHSPISRFSAAEYHYIGTPVAHSSVQLVAADELPASGVEERKAEVARVDVFHEEHANRCALCGTAFDDDILFLWAHNDCDMARILT